MANVKPIVEPDRQVMLAHLEHLFGGFLDGYHDGLLELAWTDTTPDERGKYKLRNARLFATDQLDELAEEAARLNSTPMCNVYIGAWLRHPHTAPFARSNDSDAWALTAAYVDLDDPGATSKVKDIYGRNRPTWITVTGKEPHTRAQLWWRLDEPITDHDRGRALINGMAKAMNGDPDVRNTGRVMRLAGSVAWPHKPGRAIETTYRSPLKEPGLPIYAAGHMEALFPPIPEGSDSTIDTGSARTRSGSLGLGKVADGRERYMRDSVLACLIQYIGENGAEPTPQELFDIAWPQYERNTDFTRPGRGKEELADKCLTTLRRFQDGKVRGVETLDKAIDVWRDKQVARLRYVTEAPPKHAPPAEDINATPFVWTDPATIPPRGWVYGHHYIRSFLSTTVAPGGVGKSSLIIAEALTIASGSPILGQLVDERTNVWLWNGEDPEDELYRRVMASALHHKLTPQQLEGRLFLDTGRKMPIVIAEKTRDGVVVHAPVVEQVIRTIKEHSIGVMTIDPFISSHRVTENDNSEIERVAKTWAWIADETRCSIELVHHVRKTGGAEVQVEDGRGAVALLAAARAARTINPMNEDEGAKAGVDNHRFYFRTDNGKANLAPPAEGAIWFHLSSFDLGNATKDRPSDKIGVVENWTWPDPSEGVTASDLEMVRNKVRDGKYRADVQAKEWVGYAIIDVLGLEVGKGSIAKAKALQAMWTKNGALVEHDDKDDKRNSRKFVRCGS